MAKIKLPRKYMRLVIIATLLWLIETWAFGWNWKAQSPAEKFFDTLASILFFWGILGDLLTNVTIIKKDIVNTQGLKYYDQRTNGKTVLQTDGKGDDGRE